MTKILHDRGCWKLTLLLISVVMLSVTAGAAQPPAEHEDPENDSPLPGILARMANVAELYMDSALRFTCNETILFAGSGNPVMHRFKYLYRFSKESDRLEDFRVPLSSKSNADLETNRVSLDNYGLPTFLVRAYSWVFVFENDNQALYRYRFEGEEEEQYRPAYRVSFESIPPYIADLNDWTGTAWIDRETYQLLRVEAHRIEDMEQKRQVQRALAEPCDPAKSSYRGTFAYSTYVTEFDVEQNGMRFPGRSLIDRSNYVVTGCPQKARAKEVRLYHVSQTYKKYRFFGVRTWEEIAERIEAGI